jgi:hypothetical protein
MTAGVSEKGRFRRAGFLPPSFRPATIPLECFARFTVLRHLGRMFYTMRRSDSPR